MNGSSGNTFRNFSLSNVGTGGSNGLNINPNANSNSFYGLRIARSGNFGLFVSNSTDSLFANVSISHAAANGIMIDFGGERTKLVNVVSTNNANSGLRFQTNDCRVINYTGANNDWRSLSINASYALTLNHAGINNVVGTYMEGGTGTDIWNSANLANATYGVQIIGSTDNVKFGGELKVAGNGTVPCSINAGASPGLIDLTCSDTGADNSSTYTGRTSTAILRTSNLGTSNLFVGPVTTDDTENSSDLQAGNYGLNAFASIASADWASFSSPFRAWTRESANTYAHSAYRNRCTAGTCRVWDWSLSDNNLGALRDTLDQPANGSDTLTHAWSAGSSTFIRHAVEIMDDGVGNENGLCDQNGEDCLYTPNLGAYQGEGTPELVTTLSSGTYSGIRLFAYPVNGSH